MICKNLEVFKGTTKVYELQFTDDGGRKDITGWTIYFTVKENMKDIDSNAKIKKKVISHYDAINGKTLIELEISDTNLLGNYYYSIDYKDPEGNIGVLFQGRMRFIAPILQTKD